MKKNELTARSELCYSCQAHSSNMTKTQKVTFWIVRHSFALAAFAAALFILEVPGQELDWWQPAAGGSLLGLWSGLLSFRP